MKKKIEIKGTIAYVSLQAVNGEVKGFSYKIDSLPFMNFMSTVERLEKSKVENDEVAQATSFLKLFNSVKRVIGESTVEELIDWAEVNDDEISLSDFILLVTDFNNEEETDLPKE